MRGDTYLMYHEIGEPQRELCNPDPGYVRYVVDRGVFREHLEGLRRAGLRGVSVGDALHNDNAGKRVIITFDDGCETDLVVAAPMLKEMGFNATFYVTVEHLERKGYLTKTQLKELSDLGFEIGSHAMTHRFLEDLTTPEVRTELAESKRVLEEITGKPVAHFSCPGGRWDARVSDEARRAGYESLVTSVIGTNAKRADRLRLKRVAVLRGMGAAEIERVARGRGLFKKQARSALFNAAKRMLGNRLYEQVRAQALKIKTAR